MIQSEWKRERRRAGGEGSGKEAKGGFQLLQLGPHHKRLLQTWGFCSGLWRRGGEEASVLFPSIFQGKLAWEFSFILLISSSGKKQALRIENRHQEIIVENIKDTETTQIHSQGGGENIKREKGKTKVSLAHNGSQVGNGLLHLIHIASRELEHRGD